jgi:hypothetical protein
MSLPAILNILKHPEINTTNPPNIVYLSVTMCLSSFGVTEHLVGFDVLKAMAMKSTVF